MPLYVEYLNYRIALDLDDDDSYNGGLVRHFIAGYIFI